MARALVRLPLVLRRLGAGLRRAEADAGEPVTDDVGRHVAGIAQAVDVADLVAVVRRDRHLDEAIAGGEQLQQDLGVEVEAVAVGLERDARQRGNRERAVAAVPLAQRHPGHGVLECGQDAVADELVRGHPAAASGATLQHPRPEHDLGVAGDERGDHRGEQFGRVLAVAVEEHDDVQALLDRPPVAVLLVAPVAEVARLADDGERQIGAPPLVAAADVLGVVLGVVVADEDRRDARPEVGGDAVEHPLQRGGRVVGDDHDADPWLTHAAASVPAAVPCRPRGARRRRTGRPRPHRQRAGR